MSKIKFSFFIKFIIVLGVISWLLLIISPYITRSIESPIPESFGSVVRIGPFIELALSGDLNNGADSYFIVFRRIFIPISHFASIQEIKNSRLVSMISILGQLYGDELSPTFIGRIIFLIMTIGEALIIILILLFLYRFIKSKIYWNMIQKDKKEKIENA